MIHICLLFSKNRIISFEPSQGWYVYQLLLFSSFHTGCIYKFKQLIWLVGGPWVEEGWEDGRCWIQISNPVPVGINVVGLLNVEVSPLSQQPGNRVIMVVRLQALHILWTLSKNTKDTDTYSKLQRIHKEREALSTNNSRKTQVKETTASNEGGTVGWHQLKKT